MQVGDRVTVYVRNGREPEGPYIVDDLSIILVASFGDGGKYYHVHRQPNGKYQMDEFVEDYHKICSADGIKITDDLEPGQHIFVHMMDIGDGEVSKVIEYKVLNERLVRAYDPYSFDSYHYFGRTGTYYRTMHSNNRNGFKEYVQYAPFSYDRTFARQLSPETRSLLAALVVSSNEQGKISYRHREKERKINLTGVMIGIKSSGKAGQKAKQKIFPFSEQSVADIATFGGVCDHYPLELGTNGDIKQSLRGAETFRDVSNIYQVLVQARLPYEYVNIVPKRKGVEYAPEQLVRVRSDFVDRSEVALKRWTLYWLPASELKDYLAALDD